MIIDVIFEINSTCVIITVCVRLHCTFVNPEHIKGIIIFVRRCQI